MSHCPTASVRRGVLPQVLVATLCAAAVRAGGQERAGGGGEQPPDGAPEQIEDLRGPPSRLAEMPHLPLDTSKHTPTMEQRDQIARLIARLVEIDRPDYGMAPRMSGFQFAPVGSSRQFGAGIIMVDHGLKTSEALEQLVALGPRALPALLEGLTDATPTKHRLEHARGFGGMWYGREVAINPVNPRESKALDAHAEWFGGADRVGELELGNDITEHTVTRADVCFVIIGQIVNRAYQAARYQPTACLVVNSPTHDPQIAKIVREIWESADPAETLFRSLLMDFYSRGGAAEYQIGAATRLLYYFPEESRDLIVGRLDSFDVRAIRAEGDWKGAWHKQREANGDAMPYEFIKAVAFSDDPAITGAVVRVLQRTDDPDVFQECLTEPIARANPELMFKRMGEIVAVALPAEQGPFGGEYYTLRAGARFFPEKSRPLLDTYLKHGTLATTRATVAALQEPAVPVPWAVEFLTPLLEDRTDTGWRYGPDYDRKPIRVCDEAAEALTFHVPGATFTVEGETENLDRQIENLRLRIAGRPVADEPVVKAKIDFDAVARRGPQASFTIAGNFPHIYDFSDEKALYLGCGYQADGWAWDTVTIDAAGGREIGRTRLDVWRGGVKVLQPIVGDTAVCFHDDTGGEMVIRDIRTGKELGRAATPFHGRPRPELGFRDPMLVRGMRDLYLTSDGKAAVALTPDGSLHSVDLATARHEVLWKREGGDPRFERMPLHGTLVPVRGTSRMLLEFFGPGADRLRVWDHDTRAMTEIEKVPGRGWRNAWGRYAVNHVNDNVALWDLEARKPIELPLPEDAAISEVICDSDQSVALVVTAEGTVWAIDLAALTPRARLQPPDGLGRTTLWLSRDDRTLFWKSDENRDGPRDPERQDPKCVVAVFDVSDLTR